MTAVFRGWQWAAAAVTIGLALPGVGRDVLSAWHGDHVIGLIAVARP
jgi:hypothetical protein